MSGMATAQYTASLATSAPAASAPTNTGANADTARFTNAGAYGLNPLPANATAEQQANFAKAVAGQQANQSANAGKNGTWSTTGGGGLAFTPSAPTPTPSNPNSPIQTTTALRTGITDASTQLDNTLGKSTSSSVTTTGTPANSNTTVAVPAYGSTVKDANGATGIAKFDPNTGKPLNQPDNSNKSGQLTVDNNGNLTDSTGAPVNNADYTKTLNSDGTTSYTDKNGTVVAQGQSSALVQANADTKQAMDIYNQAVGRINASTDNLIAGIQSSYAARITAMQASNASQEAKVTQQGYATGRTRYTPGIQAGILSNEEQLGVMRINTLSTQMNTAIANAETARDNQDAKALTTLMDQTSKIKTELTTQINNQYTQSKNAETLLLQQQRDANNLANQQHTQGLADAKAAAPAIAKEIKGMSATESADFLQKYADSRGIDIGVLMGEVTTAGATDAKNRADLANIQSEIDNRGKTNPNAPGTKDIVSNGVTVPAGDVKQVFDFLQNGDPSGKINGTVYNARGDDTYVDPNLYNALATKWVKSGAGLADFLKTFPVSNVNPDDHGTLLPAIQATIKKSATGSNNRKV